MPSKSRKRWPPSMGEFKKMVAIVSSEVTSTEVMDIFHAMRRRCPEWAVTPHRVRKALLALQRAAARSSGKARGSGARGSGEAPQRAFPHDVVELRPGARSARHGQWQWRGQVLRMAGYDDGETSDDEDHELPAGHCSVFWLGHGLEQWPNALTKEVSLRVLDRPWVLGDRVARVDDPRSLGTVVGVTSRLRPCGVPGPAPPAPEVPVRMVRAVGGFRAEDWVAHQGSRWVGKVEEAVFRVEVELCSKSEQWPQRGKGRRRPPSCLFQVSSEGLQGLEPAGGEDVTPQELSPHFPGQRVRAPARLWRQAEWLRGSLGRRSPRRGTPICGVVASVECCLLAVRWLAGSSKDSQPPDEWVSPELLRVLVVPNSSEGWAIGDHMQVPSDWHSPSAVIVESRTTVDVRWADGSVEEALPSLRLCPRPHVSARDFLPLDFVARSGEGFGDTGASFAASSYLMLGAATSGAPIPPVNFYVVSAVTGTAQGGNADVSSHMNDMNNDENMLGYGGTSGEAPVGSAVAPGDEDILPVEELGGIIGSHLALTPVSAVHRVLVGVVVSVDLNARTAVVQWASSTPAKGPQPDTAAEGDREEVSVFELTEHPQVDVRLGDAVIVPDASEGRWAGRVTAFRADACARVELLDGRSEWHEVRRLVVVDDGEGSESAGGDGASEEGSMRSMALSDTAPAIEIDESNDDGSDEDKKTAEAHEYPWAEEVEELSPRSLGFGSGCGDIEKCGDATGEASSAGAFNAASAAGAAGAAAGARAVSSEVAAPAATESAEVAEACRRTPNSAAMPLAFDSCDEDVEPWDHFFISHTAVGSRQRMIAVRREMVVLRQGLLDGEQGCAAPIFVRTFSSRSDLFRAMVVGPPDTPYAYVPIFFDLALPAEYPREPPLAHFHAHFVGNERLNPNLYVDGKVCLSLLGTWSGPAWDPSRSTLLQVLVSLQGLVLVEEPYFNEPGHECDQGTEQGRQSSALYNEHARLLALRAALNVSQSPPRGFEEIVASFFARYGQKLVEDTEEALRQPKASESSEGFRKVLAKSLLPRMRARWGSGVELSAPVVACASATIADTGSTEDAAPTGAPLGASASEASTAINI